MKKERYKKEIEELLVQLTLEEKVGMIHGAGLFRTEGVKRLDIPGLYMSDGPMGVRAEFADNEWRNIGTTDDYVSYLPCNSAIASTWNPSLAKKTGEVLGEETRSRGKDVILAPGINVKRSPLCGRNFEYIGEDPYHISKMAVPLIQGIQESDVAACVKHFAANGQETERLWVDTIVSKRALREIYFPAFHASVKEGGTYSLMGAYNLINGEHCCMSQTLLNGVLRKEWEYDGTIISDWGGVHDTKLAAESALDIEMDVHYKFDDHFMARPLLEKVRNGEIKEELIDEKVRNILRMMFRLKMIGPEKGSRKAGTYNTPEHQKAILEVARESLILLKNEDKVLPLNREKAKKVAVIGQNAAAIHSNGGGSAEIKALYEISPLMGIKKLLGGNAQVSYAPGYYIPPKAEASDVNWQADSTKKQEKQGKENSIYTEKSAQLAKEAVELACDCDTVIFVGGLNHDFDVEGLDRVDMKLPYGQDELITELLRVRPDMVVVLYAGSPVEMPWKDEAKVILWSYYNGMEGGTAIAETLFGLNNPSGKLAETFIKKAEDCPAHCIGTFGKEDRVEYTEDSMVGYRYYNSNAVDVNFAFGHGLSYSDFSYHDLVIEPLNDENDICRVSFTVKNESNLDGKEIAQCYVAPGNSRHNRPVHELRCFEKCFIEAGSTKRIEFVLDKQAFSYFDEEADAFIVKKGEYEIQIGTSSQEICLRGKISVE